MQISSSINLFGIERIPFQQSNPLGLLDSQRNETNGMRWVIKPKFETPMLNFNSTVRKTSVSSGSLTLPEGFASNLVPRGMWHQFGIIEPDTEKGIFMEIDDIPKSWLYNHYKVVNEPSPYNNNRPGIVDDPESNGNQVHRKIKSLTQLFGFNSTAKKARLGELANKRKVKEAVVVIPYVTTAEFDQQLSTHPEQANDRSLEGSKEFFGLDPLALQAAIRANLNTPLGQNLDVAGESIRKLIAKMDNYILPPEFDFIRNPETTPIVCIYLSLVICLIKMIYHICGKTLRQETIREFILKSNQLHIDLTQVSYYMLITFLVVLLWRLHRGST